MALFQRVYFNAVFGALGGLLGWMLFGLFGDANPSSQQAFGILTHEDLNLLLGGALIGGLIGYFVVAVDAIRDQSLPRFARLGSYGVVLGAFGGALGMGLGDAVNYALQNRLGGWLIAAMIARGLGWSVLGIAIGASEGIAARSLGKLSYGMLGGAIGGFIGGVLFELFNALAKASLTTTYFWNALGLTILGACIGALSAFVRGVFQPACVRVVRGWQEGREYALDKAAIVLGRAEDADIALFRDMKVEKAHATIRREGQRFVLVNTAADTRVNDAPVSASRLLTDGDRIQLGNVILRFELRAARVRTQGPRRGS